MADDLTKMDRWNSEPLDVHTWSDHPEIKTLCDDLYDLAGMTTLEPKGNRKAKRTVKESLRVLILDLYVKWLKDPSISIGFSKGREAYTVGSRYNGLFVPRKVVDLERLLVEAGYIEELKPFQNQDPRTRNYTTRIRHTEALRDLFSQLTIDLHDIDTHANEECIILHDKYVDDPNDDTVRKIEYNDKDLPDDELALLDTLRGQLTAYNKLLNHTFIDIPSYTSATFKRTINKGRNAGRQQTISLGPDNKFVIRVFNGGLAGKWERGGRFYRGWWQQIDKEDRSKIYLNDQPTLEVDFKAFHPNLLSNELGVRLADDPYDLGELILPDVVTTTEQQRAYVKLLVLMGINADSDKKAYQAFRNSDRKDKLGQSLTDIQLAALLDAFIDKQPQFKGVLNTGQALRLMNIDSQIANMVLEHFTNKNIPVLCIHDSFIIQYDKEPELRRILDQATHQVTNYTINHDIKNDRNSQNGRVSGNLKGYEEAVVVSFHTPIRIEPTKQYNDRKAKFTKWLALPEYK
ncbi:hypothetical protein LY10_03483 [Planktotalea frisia]|uniref:hypothetical protein n=1 Tax=Planktotalea frisia TaxID=696762 RepID=UPI000932A56E|nr:hypothetical protein [Planktotalea frisia]PZX21730.1 hypothetical protein LY10_03483 [Planktotalea frisia]